MLYMAGGGRLTRVHGPFVSDGEVEDVVRHLKAQGVPTAVYYPIPLHLQPAYDMYPRGPQGLPVTERLMTRVISLPMHADLDEATQDRIIAAVASYKG